MARSLNKSRILVSKLTGLFVLAAVVLTYGFIREDGILHEFFALTGLLMVSVCALARVYTTAYLGGAKNGVLITYGPFSVVRNPLYVFSFIGFAGIALMTSRIVLMIGVPAIFLILYIFLIKREEVFLLEKFGEKYKAYCQHTPRLFPRFSNYNAPESIQTNTKLFYKGAMDAVWWFAAFPLIEMIEHLHKSHLIEPLFFLP